MAKDLIIDGVDVSGCSYGEIKEGIFKCSCEYNVRSASMFCKDNPNCYYKQLKRKEQKCEELKAKCSQLEEKIKDWQKEVERIQFIGSYGIMDEVKKNTKLKNCLTEIKDMCSEINCESLMQNSWCGNTDFKMGCCEKLFKKQILQKINECEVENERKENCN